MATLYDEITLGYTACGGHKAGKAYSFKPIDGSGDFTCVRATTPNRVNKDGDSEVVPANTPVIDWSTGSPLLIVSAVGELTLTTPATATKVIITVNGVATEYNNIFPTLTLPIGSISTVIATVGDTEYDLLKAYLLRVSADSGIITEDNARGVKDFFKEIEDSGITPSLAMTADSAIKAGKIYSQIPSDGSGDFTVARNSATATRVRPDGYIEPVADNVPRIDYSSGEAALLVEAAATNLLPYYKSFARAEWNKSGAVIEGDASTAGSELVVNGSFTTDTNWTKETGWAINVGTGKADVNNTTASSKNIYQSILTAGKYYLITYTVSNYISGTIRPFANGVIGVNRLANGTYTEYIISDGSILYFNALNGTQLSIDNISIKEVTGFTCPVLNSDGSNSMAGYKLVENTSNGIHFIYYNAISIIATNLYSSSCFVKKAERSRISLGNYNGDNALFDLNNGTIISKGNCNDAIIEPLIDGWYKITTIFDGVGTGERTYLYLIQNTSLSYQGDGTSGIYISHANLVQASAPSSLILGTEGSTVNRIADAVSKTGIAALIGQTEGTFIIEFEINSLTNDVTYIDLQGVNTDSRIFLRKNTNAIAGQCQIAAGVQASIVKNPITIGRYKAAFAYKENDFAFALNGELVGTDTSGALPSMSKIGIGSRADGAAYINSLIYEALIFKTRLSNTQLQQLTTL